MPRRGELVRLFGEELRASKDALAALVTIEAGKIAAEARGEVQKMIDICDFAAGLSRQLYNPRSHRAPGHRMSETWHRRGDSRSAKRYFSRPVRIPPRRGDSSSTLRR